MISFKSALFYTAVILFEASLVSTQDLCFGAIGNCAFLLTYLLSRENQELVSYNVRFFKHQDIETGSLKPDEEKTLSM